MTLDNCVPLAKIPVFVNEETEQWIIRLFYD